MSLPSPYRMGNMGGTEFALRVGAASSAFIPVVGSSIAAWPTAYDGYGCLASASFQGNYD